MDSKRYFSIIVLPVALLVVILFSLSFYLQPFTGDLTRIGGYTENDYGWNASQFGFNDAGTGYAGLGKKSEFVDYAIYGDSFSHWCLSQVKQKASTPCFQWTAFFKNITGLSGFTFHQDKYGLDSFVQQVQQSNMKPRFVIYQSVERYAIPRLMSIANGAECDAPIATHIQKIVFKNVPIEPSSIERNTTVNNFNINVPTAYIKQLLLSLKKPRVLREPIVAKSALFSNDKSNELIYHYEDMKKSGYSDKQLLLARCGMKAFAAQIYQVLGVPTIFFIAPDKSALYGNWFEDQTKKVASIIPGIIEPDVNFVDIYTPMVAAANAGVVDIYLPNDTHWGSNGGKIAAEALAQFIKLKTLN